MKFENLHLYYDKSVEHNDIIIIDGTTFTDYDFIIMT